MDDLRARQVRYYMRLNYPLAVTSRGEGFVAQYLDLPGCESFDIELSRLHHHMEGLRRKWIVERVQSETPIPLPNSHLRDSKSPTLHADIYKGSVVKEEEE